MRLFSTSRMPVTVDRSAMVRRRSFGGSSSGRAASAITTMCFRAAFAARPRASASRPGFQEGRHACAPPKRRRRRRPGEGRRRRRRGWLMGGSGRLAEEGGLGGGDDHRDDDGGRSALHALVVGDALEVVVLDREAGSWGFSYRCARGIRGSRADRRKPKGICGVGAAGFVWPRKGKRSIFDCDSGWLGAVCRRSRFVADWSIESLRLRPSHRVHGELVGVHLSTTHSVGV
jgi:hypothetical protein